MNLSSLFPLQFLFQVSVDDMQEKIEELDGMVQSTDVVTFSKI
jgi:translation elongation factor EF-1beta